MDKMYSDLAILSCGNYNSHQHCSDIFENLSKTISTLERRIISLPESDDETITLLGPFYARTLLETVCTSLVGRIDPFRIMFLRQVQKQDNFGISSRSKSAIAWFGDIFEKGLEQSALDKMWSSNKEFSSVGRALFGDYYGEIFWKPAFELVLDNQTDYIGEQYLSDTFTRIPIESLTQQLRTKISGLYSSLSKGVHSELVIRTEMIYDRSTVLPLISEVIELSSFITLLSHKLDSVICKIDFQEAVQKYVIIKEWCDNYGG